MKRLLFALFLLLPSLAFADGGRLLIIYPSQSYGIATSTILEDDIQRQALIAHCNLWKIRYTLVPAASCNTWMVRRGTFQRGAGDSITHDAVAILGFQVGRMNTEVPGFCPESLTLSVCAPTVPVILSGVPVDAFTQTAGCSTGVTVHTLGASSLDSLESTSPHGTVDASGIVGAVLDYEGFGTKYAYAWKAYKQNNSSTTAAAIPPGLWRPLVRTYRSVMTGAGSTCLNCDAPHASTGNTGKFQLWMRDQYSIGDRSLFKPIYFVHAHRLVGGANPQRGGFLNMALALASADSFASGAIYGSSPEVRKVAFVITGLNKRRAVTTMFGGSNGFQGLPSEISSPDSAAIMVAADSVAAYSIRDDIPVAVGCEVDSLDDYPRDQVHLLDRLHRWKVFPFGVAGKNNFDNAGNTSNEHPMDLQAYDRTTTAFGSLGVTQGPESCYVWRGDSQQVRDTSLVCKMHFALNLLRARFGSERVSPFYAFSEFDYKSRPSITAMGEDSMFSAMRTGGIAATLIAVRGWVPANGRYNEKLLYTSLGARGPGRFKFLSAGPGKSTIGAQRSILVAVEYSSSAVDGFFTGISIPSYQNKASTTGSPYAQATSGAASVLNLDSSYFGTGSNGINNLYGARVLKYVANQVATFNNLAGRKLLVWDWPENVTVSP